MSKKTNTSVSPAHIDWAYVSAKREMESTTHRVMGMDMLDMTDRSVRVLSFPAAGWAWEHGLMGVFPSLTFNFTGIERDPEVHAKAAATLPPGIEASMFPYPCTLKQYLKNTSPETENFDVIYLDWMGTWSQEKKADLVKLFTNPSRLNRGGLLLMTMALSRGQPATMNEIHDMAHNHIGFLLYDQRGRDSHISGMRVKGIPMWIVEEAERHGIYLNTVMAGVYYTRPTNPKQRANPMVQFLFKRVR